MSNIELLQRYGSSGSKSITNRTNFHIYLWPYDGSSTLQGGIPALDYYATKGMNFTRDHYDISGTGAYIQANLNTQLDFWAARAEALRIDLWWVDTETSFYTGRAADAATDLTGAQNGTSWSKARWAVTQSTIMYVGNYGANTGIRTQGIISYPFNSTPTTYSDLRNDNDVNGVNVANTWDFMGPELYQTKIDEFIQGLDWLCNEKARIGTVTPLIPLIWRHGTPSLINTYNFMTAQLEYAYSRPECNGLILWGTETADVAPNYYDAAPWMQATLDFMAKYNIKRGTPF